MTLYMLSKYYILFTYCLCTFQADSSQPQTPVVMDPLQYNESTPVVMDPTLGLLDEQGIELLPIIKYRNIAKQRKIRRHTPLHTSHTNDLMSDNFSVR